MRYWKGKLCLEWGNGTYDPLIDGFCEIILCQNSQICHFTPLNGGQQDQWAYGLKCDMLEIE